LALATATYFCTTAFAFAETVTLRLGNLRRRRPRASARWHLDEMVIKIRDWEYGLWRAVDDEGEVLDFLV